MNDPELVDLEAWKKKRGALQASLRALNEISEAAAGKGRFGRKSQIASATDDEMSTASTRKPFKPAVQPSGL